MICLLKPMPAMSMTTRDELTPAMSMTSWVSVTFWARVGDATRLNGTLAIVRTSDAIKRFTFYLIALSPNVRLML